MSQKRKRGLQSGLSEIVARQTAPVPDKSRESSSLIAKFREQPQVDSSDGVIDNSTATPLPPPAILLQPKDELSVTIAPARDFARVANSIARDAMPGGLFKGTSKKLYDALYLRTRGAIVPQREIKARQSDLMQWAGVSHNTLRSHIHHLEAVRLIEIKWELGDNGGAVYEVRLPEEIPFLPPPTTSLQPPPPSNQFLGGPSTQKLVLGGGGQTIENTASSADPKTSFKTNTERSDDDEAFAGFASALNKAFVEVTGRELSRAEAPRLAELAEVLVTEFKIAAARTTVSSAPSFLAEHLRRRLWKLDKRQAGGEGKQATTEEKSTLSIEQIKNCPDCGGSGMYYPEGYDKGVAKCKHEKISREGKDQNSES